MDADFKLLSGSVEEQGFSKACQCICAVPLN